MKINRAILEHASQIHLNAHWFHRNDLLKEMGFPTTAEVHERKLGCTAQEPYQEDELRLTMIDSILSMEAVITEHKDGRGR